MRDGDGLLWGLGGSIFIGVVAIVWLIVAEGRATEAAEEKFMAACTQHEPEYRCTAMWRAGDSAVPAVPIVVPVAR